jgi:putative nucleotidyltransferase with HDIG domain
MIRRGKQRAVSPLTAAMFGAALAILLLVALFPVFPQKYNIRVGDIASRTVKSPRTVSFQSETLTRQQQDERAGAITPSLVFEPAIRSEQINAYENAVSEVSEIRSQDLDAERKRAALSALELSPRAVETVLVLSDERWRDVINEGRRVLTEELSVSLDEASVPGRKDSIDSLIAPEFIADEALLTAELVRPRIVSTLIEDQARTEEAREAARAAVPPVLVNVEKGDIILAAETRVDEVAIEKLEAANLVAERVEWDNVAAAAILCVIAAGVVSGYLYVMQPRGVTSERHMVALAVVMAVPLLIAKFYLPVVLPDESRDFLPYILPIAAAPILIAALLETDVAIVTGAILGGLVAFVTAFLPDVSLVASIGVIDTLRLLLVYAVAPMAGVFLVHRASRLSRYLTAGIAVSAVAYVLLIATWLIDGNRQAADLGWMFVASGVGGVSSGVLAAGAFVTAGVLFGVTTRVHLMELSQLNSPLLRRLQDEAPGTFHHSIIVGNLAERAADLVGADPLLTRVGCYYHDIGKVLQPGMYIENQLGGETPHETMPPSESAAIIKQHVSGGVDLARRERLPARVQAFIPEHHGTRLVSYFYRKAAEDDPSVDPALYQYPGPRPQSRETAIVMLADSTEALIRSSPDRSPARIGELVEEVLAERLAEGQLDESDHTLRDLRTIAESFKSTMRAVYHPRVQYPEPTALEERRRVLRLPLRSMPGRADTQQTRRTRKYER